MLQAKGGGLAFVHQNPRSLEENASDGKPASVLLAYINADHEYVLFHPHGEQLHEGGISHRETLAALEETGRAPTSYTIYRLLISYYNSNYAELHEHYCLLFFQILFGKCCSFIYFSWSLFTDMNCTQVCLVFLHGDHKIQMFFF